MSPYVHKVLLGLDRSWNAILGGEDRETISSRVGRGAVAGYHSALIAEKIIDFFFGKGHCRRSIGK